MLRRSLLELSHRRLSIRRVPRQISCQVPSFVCPQRDFSSSTQRNESPGSGSASKPSGSGGNLSKVIIGSVAIGTIIMGAYSIGYLDHIFVKMPPNSSDSVKDGAHKDNQPMPEDGKGPHHTQIVGETPSHTGEGVDSSSSHVDTTEKPTESQSQLDLVEDSNKHNGEDPLAAISTSDVARGEVDRRAEDKESPAFSLSKEIAEDQDLKSKKSIEGGTAIEGHGNKTTMEQHEEAEKTPQLSKENVVSQDDNMEQNLQGEPRPNDQVKDSLGHAQAAQQTPSSLLDAYYLRDDAGESASTSLGGHMGLDARHSSSKEVSPDAYVSEDGKLILDFLQAIHAAEQRQAELDARLFAEEKRMMKSKYEKELKDARARELMYAEEAAMLEKELQKERAKAAAALKSFLEKAEERLKMELEQKEREAETKLKEVEESAKAELAASIAREKAAHIEKMAEANLNINALCMAFYARSEEARQSHSVHRLALGALALEDAVAKGLPIQTELDALRSYVEGVDKDSLLDLALLSLPEDARIQGTDTLLQLNQKFDTLKRSLRHFSLLPPGGGGILAHSLAYLASYLKVKENDQSGDGIESVINKVEGLLAEGKLAEAADVLENGVRGSKAAEVAGDWARRARNRAITEQALTLLQSYATSGICFRGKWPSVKGNVQISNNSKLITD